MQDHLGDLLARPRPLARCHRGLDARARRRRRDIDRTVVEKKIKDAQARLPLDGACPASISHPDVPHLHGACRRGSASGCGSWRSLSCSRRARATDAPAPGRPGCAVSRVRGDVSQSSPKPARASAPSLRNWRSRDAPAAAAFAAARSSALSVPARCGSRASRRSGRRRSSSPRAATRATLLLPRDNRVLRERARGRDSRRADRRRAVARRPSGGAYGLCCAGRHGGRRAASSERVGVDRGRRGRDAVSQRAQVLPGGRARRGARDGRSICRRGRAIFPGRCVCARSTRRSWTSI